MMNKRTSQTHEEASKKGPGESPGQETQEGRRSQDRCRPGQGAKTRKPSKRKTGSLLETAEKLWSGGNPWRENAQEGKGKMATFCTGLLAEQTAEVLIKRQERQAPATVADAAGVESLGGV